MRRPSGWHLVLAPMALLFALPLLWLMVSSFMTNAQINRFPPTIIPDSLHLDGYRYVFETGRFGRWSLNSSIVAFTTVVSNLVFVMTRGGPLQSTTVVVLYVWQQAFQFFNAGYGAAAAYVLAFGLLVVALAWGWYQRRRQARLA